MELESFAELVSQAIDSLPEEFLEALENVQVDIEEWPTPEDLDVVGLSHRDKYGLLGLYHGVPLTQRGENYNLVLPDKISIYQEPIESMCSSDEEIREQVRITVLHELAHHFGIDDDRLHELGMG